jgi:hypothetical protein
MAEGLISDLAGLPNFRIGRKLPFPTRNRVLSIGCGDISDRLRLLSRESLRLVLVCGLGVKAPPCERQRASERVRRSPGKRKHPSTPGATPFRPLVDDDMFPICSCQHFAVRRRGRSRRRGCSRPWSRAAFSHLHGTWRCRLSSAPLGPADTACRHMNRRRSSLPARAAAERHSPYIRRKTCKRRSA